ncbi:MAG: DUF58 domain-containing protein [Prevotellaceae bacterium]|jgi:hypothetical protein|nr:DUF58 domain-containing protein [Prevotellaceae bacterium]
MKDFIAAKQLIAKRKPRILRILDAFPLRLNFFLLVALSLIGYSYILSRQSTEVETSMFYAILIVLLKLVLVFIIILVVCSFLLTLIPFSLFSHRARNNKSFLTISFETIEGKKQTRTIAHVKILRLSFPILSSVKLRFYYDGNRSTKAYFFAARGFSFLFAHKADLECDLDLFDIRSYTIDSVKVQFKDMFNLFSFSHCYKLDKQFYTFPKKEDIEVVQPTPTLARETNLRTEIVRRVEGELLFFKDFEPSDDIRRIIWKIYAKTKELVVRVPELRNPFTSEVGFFASYYNGLLSGITSSSEMGTFLNHYKNMVWSLYSELRSKSDISLKLLYDQEVHVKPMDDVNEVQQIISSSEWQNSKDVSTVFRTDAVSILCLSALANKEDVENIVGKLNSSSVVVLCKFSETFDIKNKASYIRMLFMKPKNKNEDKPLWTLSPLRAKLVKNEQELEEILKKSEANVFVVNG